MSGVVASSVQGKSDRIDVVDVQLLAAAEGLRSDPGLARSALMYVIFVFCF